VVLGAGGAARAVCAALRGRGVGELVDGNRTAEKARELARLFKGKALDWGSGELEDAVSRAELVVNATALGLGGEGSPLPPGARFRRGALAYDLVYRPRLTPFLRAAQGAGARCLGGLGMLVSQAAAAWRIWLGGTFTPSLLQGIEEDLA
jgi:shikimate dehydrogenase